MQETEGYITSIAVATGEAGSEVGNALRTIMARVYKIGKDGLESEGKPEKMLNQVGVAVRDSEGNFRKFANILTDLDVKWKTMSDTERIAVAQQVAGTQRYNQFISLMNNYKMATDATTTALNSQGSATKENEIHMQSAQAKIQVLKTTIEGFWLKMINSDAVIGVVEGLTKMVNTFGNLPSILGIITSAMLILKGQAITKLIEGLMGATSATGLISKAMTGLNSVFMKNPIGLATIAITGLIGAFIALQPHIETTAEKIEGLKKSSDNLSMVQSNEGLVNKYKELQKTINNTNTPVEKLTEAKKQLLEVQKQLAEQYPDLIDKIDDEGKHLVTNLDAVQDKINEDKTGAIKKAQQEYQKVFSSLTDKKELTAPADVENGINPITTELPSEIEMYQKLYDKQSQWTDAENKRFEETKKNLTDLNNAVLQIKKSGGDISNMKMFNFSTREMEDATQRIKELDQASKEASNSKNNTPIEIGSEEKINILSDSIKELNSTSNLSEESVKRLANVMPNLDLSNMSATDKVEALTKALKEQKDQMNKNSQDDAKKGQKSFIEQAKSIDEINKYLQEMQQNGQMSLDVMEKLATSDMFSDFTGDLTNMAQVQEYFNGKISNMKEIQGQAYAQMMGNSTVYYQNQLANGNNLQNAFNQWASNFVDVNSKSYGFDVSNYNTMNQAKAGAISALADNMGQYLAHFVGGSADAYAKELRNCKTWAELKTTMIGKIDDEINKLNQNIINGENQVAQFNKTTAIMGGNNPDRDQLSKFMDYANQRAKERLQELQAERQRIDASFGKIDGSIDTSYTAPSNPIGTYKGTDYKGGSSGGHSGTGSDTQKTINYIHEEVEALKDLKDAVDKVNDSIDQNQALAENEEGQKKIELMKQQIDLYNQLRQAQTNLKNGEVGQKNDLKQKLLGNGFSFNGDDLVGSQERLQALQDYFNKQMNASNDSALKSQYDQIKKWVDSYEKLVRDEIPNVTKDIIDINNKILSSQKEISEELQKQRDKFIKDEETKTETVKKELEKRRKALEDEKNKEDKQDELGEKQKSLNDLQQKYSEALKTNDAESIKQARKNIEDSQRELNKYLKDTNYEDTTKRIEDESTYTEEESKSKIDNINKQLSDDNILKLVHQGVTNIDDMLRNVKANSADITAPVYTVESVLRNNILPLTEQMSKNALNAVATLRSGLVNGNIGIDSNMTVTTKDTRPIDINIKQEINVDGDVTKDSLPEIQNALDDFKDEFEKFRDDVKDAVHV